MTEFIIVVIYLIIFSVILALYKVILKPISTSFNKKKAYKMLKGGAYTSEINYMIKVLNENEAKKENDEERLMLIKKLRKMREGEGSEKSTPKMDDIGLRDLSGKVKLMGDEKKKSKEENTDVTFLAWLIGGLFFIIWGVGFFDEGAFLLGLLFIGFGFIILPPVSEYLVKKYNLPLSRTLKTVGIIILFFVIGVNPPSESGTTTTAPVPTIIVPPTTIPLPTTDKPSTKSPTITTAPRTTSSPIVSPVTTAPPQKKWVTVEMFEGNLGGIGGTYHVNSDPFHVSSDRFLLEWSYESGGYLPVFGIIIRDWSNGDPVDILSMSETSGSTYVFEGEGDYFLEFSFANIYGWEVIVKDYK